MDNFRKTAVLDPANVQKKRGVKSLIAKMVRLLPKVTHECFVGSIERVFVRGWRGQGFWLKLLEEKNTACFNVCVPSLDVFHSICQTTIIIIKTSGVFMG